MKSIPAETRTVPKMRWEAKSLVCDFQSTWVAVQNPVEFDQPITT